MNAAILVAIMAIVTMLLRFLPFIVFRKETPEYISYLGRVLPAALIGMLVIYCLKDVSFVGEHVQFPSLDSVSEDKIESEINERSGGQYKTDDDPK